MQKQTCLIQKPFTACQMFFSRTKNEEPTHETCEMERDSNNIDHQNRIAVGEGNNHVTAAIIMHILRADTKKAQQPLERGACTGHALVSRAPGKLAQQTIAAHVELSYWMKTCTSCCGLLMITMRSEAGETSSDLNTWTFGGYPRHGARHLLLLPSGCRTGPSVSMHVDPPHLLHQSVASPN